MTRDQPGELDSPPATEPVLPELHPKSLLGARIPLDDKRFTVMVASPFRLDFTAWALRRRQSNVVDQWADGHYSRLFAHSDRAVWVALAQSRGAGHELVVTLRSDQRIDKRSQSDVQSLLQKMFGLTVDLSAFYRQADNDDLLKHLIREFDGLRPPRFPTVFEALVNAVACQQVSLDSGIAALNRLSRAFGISLVTDDVTQRAFPRPVDLLDVPDDGIRELGFSRQKARTIKELSKRIVAGDTELARIDQMTNDQAVGYLSSIPGIGRWSAEYVLLRGLGRLDTFPGDDVGAQNNLQRLLHLDARPGYDEIGELVARWSPYQGVVYFHLLLEKLRMKGVL